MNSIARRIAMLSLFALAAFAALRGLRQVPAPKRSRSEVSAVASPVALAPSPSAPEFLTRVNRTSSSLAPIKKAARSTTAPDRQGTKIKTETQAPVPQAPKHEPATVPLAETDVESQPALEAPKPKAPEMPLAENDLESQPVIEAPHPAPTPVEAEPQPKPTQKSRIAPPAEAPPLAENDVESQHVIEAPHPAPTLRKSELPPVPPQLAANLTPVAPPIEEPPLAENDSESQPAINAVPAQPETPVLADDDRESQPAVRAPTAQASERPKLPAATQAVAVAPEPGPTPTPTPQPNAVTPEPAPELARLPAAADPSPTPPPNPSASPTEEADDTFSRFSLLAHFGYARFDGYDPSNGSHGILLSDLNYGLESRWYQYWSEDFATFVGLDLMRVSLKPTSSRPLSNASFMTSEIELGFRQHLSALPLRWGMGIGMGTQAYYRALNATTIQMDTIAVPRITVETYLDLFPKKKLAFGTLVKGDLTLGGSADSYTVNAGSSYGAGLFIEHRRSTPIHADLLYTSRTQNSSLIQVQRKDVELRIGVSFDVR